MLLAGLHAELEESAAQISRRQNRVHRTRLPRKKKRATTIVMIWESRICWTLRVTIESDQRAVGRGQTSRVSSPNVFPASNSSGPNRRLLFDDEDQVRNLLRDTAS